MRRSYIRRRGGSWLSRFGSFTLTTLLVACAGYGGIDLKPGIANLSDVEASMGVPAMVWKNKKNQTTQMAYSSGPFGYLTFMAYFDSQGKLEKIEQVLNERHFYLIKTGMTPDEVLRILGPYRDSNSFPARDELDWNYGYCSEFMQRMEYSVMFNTKTGLVSGGQTNPDPLFPTRRQYAQPCTPWTWN